MQTMSLKKIYSSRCWIGNRFRPATICFDNAGIRNISEEKLPGAVDHGDHIIMPGVIDAHVHINEPGRTDWEGFASATAAAAEGGVTTVVDMPLNAHPVTTTVKAFEEKLAAANNKLQVNCGFYGGLIPGNLADIEPLIKAKVLGIKCFLTHSGIDEFPNVREADLEAAMQVMAKYNIPLLAHCELFDKAVLVPHEDHTSYQHYLNSRPRQWENNAIALMIKLCRKYNCKTHIVHVSSSDALDMIAEAKKEGLPLTAETCAHYIYFNAESIPDKNTLYKCAPPIREKENNELLKEALKNGLLDFITTDHSPAPPDIKEIFSGDLTKAWGGIAGLQFLLPAAWTAMKDTISLEKFIPLLTEHPSDFLNLQQHKGKLAEGYDADMLIWSPTEKTDTSAAAVRHRHKISPYIGEELFGKVYQTFVNGNLAFDSYNTATTGLYGKPVFNELL